MKRTKIALYALIFSIIILCLSACDNSQTKEPDNIQNNNDKGENVDTTPATANAPEESAAVSPLESIESKDFENYEFKFINIAYDGWAISAIAVEEETGDTVLDAIYGRNKKIEEKFNITITETVNNNAMSILKKSINAGDQSYDAAYMRTYECAPLSTQGLLYNLFDMPNMDLKNPWWDQSCVKEVSLYNKLYFVTGDINLHYNDATWILMFNKQMVATLGLDNPYQLVLDNKWTIDRFNDFLVSANYDLNGNGEVDLQDRFGLISHTAAYNPFIYGADERFISKDSSDALIFAMTSENFATKYLKIVDILSNKTATGIVNRDKYFDNTNADWQNVFFEGRSLFFAEVLGTLNISQMRNMPENFGLLPLPKYDETQQNYICNVLNTATALAIPVNTAVERTGLILEAMCAESYNSVIPAYYDVALQYKLTRDEESVKILDIIRKNRIYELGSIYSFGNVAQDITSMINSGNINIASYIEKSESKVEKAFSKLEEAYSKQ
jgi:hypothetical protein